MDPTPAPAAAPPLPAPATFGAMRALRGFSLLSRLAIGFYAIVTLFALGYAAFSGQLGRLFGEAWPDFAGTMAGVVLGVALAGACWLADRFLPYVAKAGATLAELLGPMSLRDVAVLAGASGFAEELLFRGALWPQLGLVGGALLFGLVHVVPKRALLAYPVYAAAVGLLFGLVRDTTKNVIPCMLAHAAVNAVNLLVLRSRRARANAPAAAG